MTFRLSVVHSLPSGIRLEEWIVPDTFWSFAERLVTHEAATNPNAMLSANCHGRHLSWPSCPEHYFLGPVDQSCRRVRDVVPLVRAVHADVRHAARWQVAESDREGIWILPLWQALEAVATVGRRQRCLHRLLRRHFDRDILTFNPGWDDNAQAVPEFTDVRKHQRRLKSRGLELTTEADGSGAGPASLA